MTVMPDNVAQEDADVNPSGSSALLPRETMTLVRSVFLIGFMGAGKSSVARRLAHMCGIVSVDMDTYIVRREGRSISAIFDDVGEEGFRRIESDILRELTDKPLPFLISCGGGIVLREENRAILKNDGFTVFLRVSADEAAARIGDKSTRPLFQDIEAARRLCEERSPLYEECADAIIDTADKGVRVLAHDVRQLLEEEGVLCLQRRS